MFKRCISKILTDGISPKYEAGNFYRRFLAGLQRRAGLLCQLVIFEPTRRRSAARFGLCRRRRGWRRFNFGFDSLLLAGKFRLAPLEPRARTDPGRQLSRSEFYQFAGHSVRFIYFLCFIAVLPLLYQLFFKLSPRTWLPASFNLYQKLTDHNLRRILKLDFLLNLFYFVMVIYLRLYLHSAIGFSWEKIGLIFTLMLIPFVLIEYPLGWLADKRWGEKEILTAGLIITSFATLPIAWLTSNNWLIWAGLLFLTRVGASAWETMKETYLFKHVNAGDIGVIGLSRLTAPSSYLIGALITFFLLKIIPLPHLFTILALLTLGGTFISRRLVDTK